TEYYLKTFTPVVYRSNLKNNLDWPSSLRGFKSYLKLERALSANTVEAYLHDVDKLRHFFIEKNESKDPAQVSMQDLKEFLVWINRNHELKVMPATQARILSGIKAFFKYLILENRISSDPSALLEGPKTSRKLPDTLSIIEIDLIINA